MRAALLHGFAGDPSVWADVIAAWQLPEPPRTLALPGHGATPVQPTWHDNVAAVAGELGDCDVVVGYSLGARVALALVAAGRVPRAVLIGVNPGLDDADRPARRAADAAWARVLREQGVAAFDAAWTAQPLFASQARVDAGTRSTRRARRLALDAEQLARSLEVMGVAEMPDYRAALGDHQSRLALLAGADDVKYAALARALPAASVELVPGSGHDPTLEQPALLASAIARAVVALGAPRM